MTSTALRFLTGLLAMLPTVQIIRAEHVGPVIHVHRCDDTPELERCDCEDCTPPALDEPSPETFRIDERALASLFEDVAIARGNGASNDEAVAQVMNTLVLRGIETDVEDET